MNETIVIDWEEVYEDATADELAAADTPEKVEELAALLADLAVSYLPADGEYVLDLDSIKEGIVAARG